MTEPYPLNWIPGKSRTPSYKPYLWQTEAKKCYVESQEKVFSCVACPGSGKTRFALAIAQHLKETGEIDVVIITVHNISLRLQWLAVGTEIGLKLSQSIDGEPRSGNPTVWNRHVDSIEDGSVITHQQYAGNHACTKRIAKYCKQRKVLLISDEHHHLADSKTWGESMVKGFAQSQKILLLSGTLFRHDDGIIPFVNYDENGISQPDYEYDYQRALSDRVVAPIYFPVYGGQAEWKHGTKGSLASFGDELSLIGQNRQLNTAISSDDWLTSVMSEAVERLLLLRKTHPLAAGLVIARDTEHARHLAALVEDITGLSPVLAIADEPQAHQKIVDFGSEESTDSWLIAIKMVTEGIDIPRLRVGVFATNVTTELFFRQLVGRLIRISPECGSNAPNYLYLPGHPLLIDYAQNYAEQRSHILEKTARQHSTTRGERELFEPLWARAVHDKTISTVSLEDETAVERLDRSLVKLEWILNQTTALKEELIQLRTYLVDDRHLERGTSDTSSRTSQQEKTLQQASGISTRYTSISSPQTETLPKPSCQVLDMIARHDRIEGLSEQHLVFLCGLKINEISDAICTLRLEGLIENLKLTDKGRAKLGNNLPQTLEKETDIIKLWLCKLPKCEKLLLKNLFALNKKVSVDEWAITSNYKPSSLTKGKPYEARLNLIKLGLVIEGRISSSKKLYSLSPSLKQIPPVYRTD